MILRFWHRKIFQALLSDGVVLGPTDTVYGFLCSANSLLAVQKVIDLKNRSSKKGLILIAHDVCLFEPYVQDKTDLQKIENDYSIQNFPTTYVLPAKKNVSPWLTGYRATVAVRLVRHSFIQTLCKGVGNALVATSANHSGHFLSDSFWFIQKQFRKNVEACIYENVIPLNKNSSQIIQARTGFVLRKA